MKITEVIVTKGRKLNYVPDIPGTDKSVKLKSEISVKIALDAGDSLMEAVETAQFDIERMLEKHEEELLSSYKRYAKAVKYEMFKIWKEDQKKEKRNARARSRPKR